jgi:hypothetical protein
MTTWHKFPAQPLDRVFVAGVQPRSGSCIAYWWLQEDVTDEKGFPMERPDAIRWTAIPEPPTEDCIAAANEARSLT